MRNLLVLLTLLFITPLHAQPSTSVINLPGKGEIKPQPNDPILGIEVFTISLDRLIKNVQYDVTCVLSNNNNEAVDMRFDISQPQGGGYGLFNLNNLELENNQGTIPTGDINILTVPLFVNDLGSAIIFKNLDFTNSVFLTGCVARPIVKNPQSTTQ